MKYFKLLPVIFFTGFLISCANNDNAGQKNEPQRDMLQDTSLHDPTDHSTDSSNNSLNKRDSQ